MQITKKAFASGALTLGLVLSPLAVSSASAATSAPTDATTAAAGWPRTCPPLMPQWLCYKDRWPFPIPAPAPRY